MVTKTQSTLAEGLTVIKGKADETKAKPVIRVAAYCRVSTDQETQETSFENQMATYRQIICEHPGWKLAGIYADKGLTGTSTKKRTEYQRMMKDCKKHKIDYILVKSISRLARNTVDMLETVRKLKDLGIGIYFEKERIDTRTLTSEMLLTVYAAMSQEESRSISESMKKGIRQRFEMGIPKWTKVYGFQRINRNNWAIYEPEAQWVRLIFEKYVNGDTMAAIATYLNKKKVTPPNGKGEIWAACTVEGILKNEKYIGDYLMQKTYVVDHLQHKKVKNSGALVDQYYKHNHHEPIVDRELYTRAQFITALRKSNRGADLYPYYGFLRCPECGEPMVKIMVSPKYRGGWICGGKGKAGLRKDRSSCKPFIMMDKYLDPLMLKELKGKKRVDYNTLKDKVEKITFPKWNIMEITWKDGRKTERTIEYEKASDIPNPEIKKENKDTYFYDYLVPRCGVPAAIKAVKDKIEVANSVTIISPDEEFGLPTIKYKDKK